MANDRALLLRDVGAAQLLGVHRATLRRLVAQELAPPPCRLGGSIVWRVDELRAWVAAGCPPMRRWTWPLPEGRRGRA